MPLTEHTMLVLTVPHSGTRSVVTYYKGLGEIVQQIHFLPASSDHIAQHTKKITTLRNPYKVATSWINSKSGSLFRPGSFNWEEQWTLWHEAVTKHDFEVIEIESFKEQIYGYNPNRTRVEVPIDRVQFALDLIADSGIEHPHYGAYK